MFEKFDWMLARYQELAEAVSQPEIIADQARWQRLLKEHAALEPAVEAYRAYQKTLSDLAEAREMLSQPDMAELAQDEVNRLEAEKQRQEYELRLLLLPRDPDADKNVVMEIRQGAGGDEAALFGALLMRMYTRALHRIRRAHPHQHLHRGGAAGGGGRRCDHRPQGPAHRRVPLHRPRRPVRQHHRQRRAHHPPAHGAGGDLPGREKPDQEPRQGHARAQEPPLRQAARGAGQRLRAEPPRPDRHGRSE